ncbi:MAG: nitroreductase family protein [Deltaproteobacteria bacterium]|nr:nitroreductase family protein [Deltaproteobacteria bacterium]MBW2141483.1 nitroreductase family protein [Deltaproteobacteria bacterium]MBW2322896.1 nitroreductase family protein [Deltaproteobacteria bacterium]
MSWVSIDEEQCTMCGLCLTRCERCYSEKDGIIFVQANETTCSLCGHCVALCPAVAITHQKMNMNNFIKLDKEDEITPNQFIEHIRKRRSHRNFRNKEISRDVMETLVDISRYAPTGSNVQNVEIMVIQDRKKIKKLSGLTLDSFDKAMVVINRKIDQLEAEGKEVPGDLRYSMDVLKGRKERGMVKESGKDPIFHNAPTVMIFHSPEFTSAPKDNCVIASTMVTLMAMTLGLESCYIGIFEAAAGYRPIIEELSLPPGNKIFSVLILGYPKIKYLRAVDRKPIKTQWL